MPRNFIITQLVLITSLSLFCCYGDELTFELRDSERLCFNEILPKGSKCSVEYQVIAGGNRDIDLTISGPNGKILHSGIRKQSEVFRWTTSKFGENKFCFSNEFSSFTHKKVFFDFKVEDEELKQTMEGMKETNMTLWQIDSLTWKCNYSLRNIISYQKHYSMRESTDRNTAEDLNTRVQIWSIFQSLIIVLTSLLEIVTVRCFFTNFRFRKFWKL